MKKIIDQISYPIKNDIVEFNKFMKDSLSSEVKLINSVINYIMNVKGKQFRSILCLLCARIDGNKPNSLTLLSASTVEILHVATLLHDDVVDDAEIRRGWPSINKIWKNKISILVGDYMFSKALNNIARINDMNCINILSEISRRLSEGEIMQIEKAIKKNMTENDYYKMISDKTASLISASCYLGFYSNNKDERLGESIKKFGEYLGIAYQIKDDLFDIIGNINQTGKPSNSDLKKNMLTLPYIYSLNNLNSSSKKQFLNTIKQYVSKNDKNKIKKIIFDNGGIEYSNKKIKDYSNLAKAELDNFADSIYKDSLLKAVDFNLNRKY